MVIILNKEEATVTVWVMLILRDTISLLENLKLVMYRRKPPQNHRAHLKHLNVNNTWPLPLDNVSQLLLTQPLGHIPNK